MNTQTDTLAKQIEDALVARNLRGMKTVQPALTSGYYERAARLLNDVKGYVLIGTGFPVLDTFETDGPVGAIALYDTLAYMGAKPVFVCGKPLSDKLKAEYEVFEIEVGADADPDAEAKAALAKYQPEAIIAIERPGQAQDGGYYNMRGESIAPRCACFDSIVRAAQCPTIGIGDGGNEVGMGNIYDAIAQLDIVPCATQVDELLLADVSNWGAYGLIAFWGYWREEDLLARLDPIKALEFCSANDSVDGVTRRNELTEDGLDPENGLQLIEQLRVLTGFKQA